MSDIVGWLCICYLSFNFAERRFSLIFYSSELKILLIQSLAFRLLVYKTDFLVLLSHRVESLCLLLVKSCVVVVWGKSRSCWSAILSISFVRVVDLGQVVPFVWVIDLYYENCKPAVELDQSILAASFLLVNCFSCNVLYFFGWVWFIEIFF